ncbi:Nucleoporin Ndc1 [Habropoda laboriosa]|uniref:Nucleoporin Ndc1 n=1 Tax=Habropoda laboriosa TaxID=597456 RepID=A0A0L7QLR7_9HYME|nr:Nucleoporin Ndc1 [Habropoda laboriosa]
MMKMNTKGYKELLMQRMFLAIISSIVVQFCLVTCLLFITNLNMDYTSWIQNTWTTVTSFRMWSYFCVLAIVTFFQGVICSKSYSNVPPYLKSRFIKFCEIFTSQNILLCGLHVITGSLLIWLHLSIKGEWVPFEFKQNVFSNDASGVTLSEALSMDKVPIIQHLGYLDLITMAQKDKTRRSILFTLSQPGGHPYNWNCVVEKCTGLIKRFSDDVNEACVKAQEPPLCSSNSTMVVESKFQKEYVYRMRNLTKENVPVSTEESDIKKLDNDLKLLSQTFIKAKWNNFLTYLLSKPLISYIFGEIEGGKVCHLLFNGQSVIWAAEAISSLAVLSLNEDSYGVAQKDLPLIINTLLALKQALDKLQKSNVMAKKQDGNDRFDKEIFHSLRAATKRSLYRIVTSFEAYFSHMALEFTTMEQLHSFLVYRE